MASEEPGPGPGQMYALRQAREHITVLRRAKPDVTAEIRWCPARRGIPGNEKADEWAKLAAEAGHPRGGMARVLGQDRGEGNAAPQARRTPQAGDFGEEVGQDEAVDGRPGLRGFFEEVQDSGQAEAGRNDSG